MTQKSFFVRANLELNALACGKNCTIMRKCQRIDSYLKRSVAVKKILFNTTNYKF